MANDSRTFCHVENAMNTKHLLSKPLLTALVAAMLFATSCQPMTLPDASVQSDATSSFSGSIESQSSPGPSSSSDSFVPYGYDYLIAVQQPDAVISLGSTAEAAAFGPTSQVERFLADNRKVKVSDSISRYELYVHDTVSGKDKRVGNDHSHAVLRVMSQQYLVWDAICLQDCGDTKPGLYVYHLSDDSQVLITDKPSAWPAKIDGDWILYVPSTPGPAADLAYLTAYNLATGEVITITDNLWLPSKSSLGRDYYILRDGKVVWVAATYETGVAEGSIWVFELDRREAKELKVKAIKDILHLDAAGNYVIWWQEFWHGYDLKRNALFSIDALPVGYEAYDVVGPFIADGDQVTWQLGKGNNSQDTRFLTAQVLDKPKKHDQTPVVPQATPTFARTPEPAVTYPAPTTAPTAYP